MLNEPYLINKSMDLEVDALSGCNIGWSDTDECVA